VVCDIMLSLIREGFLHQVMGPALLQVRAYTDLQVKKGRLFNTCMLNPIDFELQSKRTCS
jgi:hypothetical protein